MSGRSASGIRDDVAGLVGADRLVDDPERIARARRDTWVIAVWRSLQPTPPPAPACVVRPRSTSEVATILLRLTDDDGGTAGAGGTALEQKFTDITTLFSSLDPRLARTAPAPGG